VNQEATGGEPFARITDAGPLPGHLRGAVAAIGNFDGVHRGHQAVLRRALDDAAATGRPALVLTFEPHPRSLFSPETPLFRLTPATLRARILSNLGFGGVVEQDFTRDFASLSAADFVETVLDRRLGIGHAVTGFDFHFGRNRGGGPAYLIEAGHRHGFGVSLVDAFRDEGANVISSSRIRALIAEGDVAQAAGLLGYRFSIEAEVVGGKKLGRTLGFPTANMVLPEATELAHGIYAVRFRRANGLLHDGVASFGRRPTVTVDGAPVLETFIFDFDGDLYGETCTVSFFGWLRGEEKFDGLEPLVARMQRDSIEAKALLSGVRPLSSIDLMLAFETP
jgi:riboflavin kinase / FMN adenylyltransferase